MVRIFEYSYRFVFTKLPDQMSTSSDSKGKFDMKDTPSTFLRSSNPIEIFMSADRKMRSDLILSHPEVVGWIYVEDGIL